MDISYVTIKTESPVVITAPGSSQILTQSDSILSGTVIRGMLAQRYIQETQCNRSAHDDADFRSFFFNDLRFVAANPLVNGKRAAVLPLSLMKDKKGTTIIDMMTDKPEAGFKSFKGLATIENGKLIKASVRHSMNFHMSRSAAQERIGGHSKDGQVYTYESIDAGQTFRGAVIGEADTLQRFWAAVGNKGKAYSQQLGRSKHSQYGLCRITIAKPVPLTEIVDTDQILLVLAAPLIPVQGMATQARDVLAQEIALVLNRKTGHTDVSEFTIGKICSASQNIENFVGIWRMRAPGMRALAAGTIFELQKKSPWTEADKKVLRELLYLGCGLRCEEGFGQLRIWHKQKLTMGEVKQHSDSVAPVAVQSVEVKATVSHILQQRIRERLSNYAYEDVQNMQGLEDKSRTHAFARMESALGKRGAYKNVQQNFLAWVNQAVEAKSPMENHLNDIRIHNVSLFDIFHGQAAMPYETDERKQELKALSPDDLKKEIGFKENPDEQFYDYWLWVFRHGRKRAVAKNREQEVDEDGNE